MSDKLDTIKKRREQKMKIKFNVSAIGLSLKETEGKDGKKFHQISIDQDGEAGSIPLTEEAYKLHSSTFKKYSPVTLTCEYNDQYKYCRVIGLNQGAVR